MKRLIFTLGLFVVTLTICIAETVFLNNTVYSFMQEIENAVQETIDENTETAMQLSSNISERWQKEQIFMSTFINHSRLEEIDQSILSMKTNIFNDQIEDFYVYSEIAKSQLNHLRDTELPLIQNIF